MTVTLSTSIGPGYTTTPTFESMRFPAGEAHIKVANDNSDKGPLTETFTLTGADANDLITLGMWADAAHQRHAHTVAFIPYLPGARQDRGLPFGAKVYADIINGFHIDQIIALDPHSPVIVNLINNLTVIDTAHIIRQHVIGRADSDTTAQHYDGIIAPDKGAVARAQAVATVCHLPLYKAEKHRNPDTGKLSGFTCETLPAAGRFLVVDDICDGGGTFMGLAESTGLPKERLGLFVSHGVFSGHAADLADHYSDIWTTNSYAADPKPAGLDDTRKAAFHTITIDQHLTRAIKAPEAALA